MACEAQHGSCCTCRSQLNCPPFQLTQLRYLHFSLLHVPVGSKKHCLHDTCTVSQLLHSKPKNRLVSFLAFLFRRFLTTRTPDTMTRFNKTTTVAIVAALVLLLVGVAHAGHMPSKLERGLRAQRLLNEDPCPANEAAGSGSVATNAVCTATADCANPNDHCLLSSELICVGACGVEDNAVANGDAACGCCSGLGKGADSLSAGLERCAA